MGHAFHSSTVSDVIFSPTEINKAHYTLNILTWDQYRSQIANFDLTGDQVKPQAEHLKSHFRQGNRCYWTLKTCKLKKVFKDTSQSFTPLKIYSWVLTLVQLSPHCNRLVLDSHQTTTKENIIKWWNSSCCTSLPHYSIYKLQMATESLSGSQGYLFNHRMCTVRF